MVENVKRYWRYILGIIGAGLLIFLGIRFRWDKTIVGTSVFLIGLITQVFGWFVGLLSTIPILGPLFVKFLELPLLFVINALGNFLILVGVKMGFKREVLSGRLLVFIFILGMMIGFIVGRLL